MPYPWEGIFLKSKEIERIVQERLKGHEAEIRRINKLLFNQKLFRMKKEKRQDFFKQKRIDRKKFGQ